MKTNNSNLLEKHLDLLGRKVEDRITGAKGIITSISYDLFGCIEAVVQDKDNNNWYDINRLKVGKRKIEMQNFSNVYIANGDKGPAEKPIK